MPEKLVLHHFFCFERYRILWSLQNDYVKDKLTWHIDVHNLQTCSQELQKSDCREYILDKTENNLISKC